MDGPGDARRRQDPHGTTAAHSPPQGDSLIATLRFAPDYLPAVLSGPKATTVRTEHRADLNRHDGVKLDFDGIVLRAWNVEMQRCTASDLDDDVAVRDGFDDRAELIAALRRHDGPFKPRNPLAIV